MTNSITASCLIRNNQVWHNGQCIYQHPSLGADSLPDFLNACYRWRGADYGKFFKMDSLCKVGWLAAELLADAVPSETKAVGVVLQNRSSSYDSDYQHQSAIQEPAACYPSPAVFVYTLPNIVIGEICIRHGYQGENALFVVPDFDADFQAGYVNYLLNGQLVRACLGGWVEAGTHGYEAFLYVAEPTFDPVMPAHTATVLADLYTHAPILHYDHAD